MPRKITEEKKLFISSKKQARDGWEQKFRSTEKKPPKNHSLLGELQNVFDKEEWEW